MKKEQERLLNMLKENKISEHDYHLIANALNKKSVFSDIENSLFINPFQRIAGAKALLLGIILMVIMSFLGAFMSGYFDGILSFGLSIGFIKAMKPNFFLLLYQNFVAVFTLSCLFFAVSIIFKQKGIRIVDFFGMVALSRYPLLVSLFIIMVVKALSPEQYSQDYTKGIEFHFSFIDIIANLLLLSCIVWQIITYFFAFKEASGIQGKKLWYSFLACILLGDIVAMIFTRWFLYT